MEKNEIRYSASAVSKRRDKIKMTCIAGVFFACSLAIFASRYGQNIFEGKEQQIEQEANADVETVSTEISQTEIPSTELSSTELPSTETASTEAVSTEETTEAPQAAGGTAIQYIDIETPDLLSKGDDWYNADLYVPGNVTSDAYFDSAVMIGDSRTEGLSLYAGLANLDAFCSKGLNIGKVMTEKIVSTDDGTVTILEGLTLKTYDNIYISFGINELGWVYDEVFIKDYKEFIDAIRAEQPDAIIYVENVLPVSKELSDEDDIYNNENIQKINAYLKEMCQEYGDVIYLDVAGSVTVDGVLPEDASVDGRHCNQEYCEKWMDYIRKNVYVKK